ncbi:hypothetical protein KIN20_020006 [Parelaphostrongylus tenuis]|uniref:Uncharacterized protein n=1 Tax=Parelaphostrongylus tenuis TaxID=148309 RepID=A0AAD5N5H9_PARTN|nr:hypothetical protein KIN20_020006 [Parelaphostrongylus tenuis]
MGVPNDCTSSARVAADYSHFFVARRAATFWNDSLAICVGVLTAVPRKSTVTQLSLTPNVKLHDVSSWQSKRNEATIGADRKGSRCLDCQHQPGPVMSVVQRLACAPEIWRFGFESRLRQMFLHSTPHRWVYCSIIPPQVAVK